MKKIILASQSPRRIMLLQWAELEFETIVKHTDETIQEGLPPDEVAMAIALDKAHSVQKELTRWAEERPDSSGHLPILAADTIVVLGNEIIGKPANRTEAIYCLKKLSGQTHQVITGVAIVAPNRTIQFSDTTTVTFYPLTDEQIAYYVDKYEPYDKAGAYAIQEWIGVVGIQQINGDFYNVMGLPVSRVIQALQLL